MNHKPDIGPLLSLTGTLLDIVAGERDHLHSRVKRYAGGAVVDENDRALLAHMDALVGKAEALLLAYRSAYRPTIYTTHKPRRAPLWARLAKWWRRWQRQRDARMPAGWRAQV